MKRHWYWFVSALVLLVVWCAPLPIRVDIGRFDSAVVSDFYPVEYGAATSFRWSQPQATLHLSGVGSGPATLQLMLSAAVQQPVGVTVAGSSAQLMVEPGFRLVDIPINIPVTSSGQVDVRIATSAPYNDGRRTLGIAIDDVHIIPNGRHLPPLPGWLLSVAVVFLGTIVTRTRRVAPALRCTAMTLLVFGLLLLRRGDGQSMLTVAALAGLLSLAVGYAQWWSPRRRVYMTVLVSVWVLMMVWWYGAPVWQPLWQTAVLSGSVALFRLRRYMWHEVRPYRHWVAMVLLALIASQGWQLALGAAIVVCVWMRGPSADPARNRASALVFGAYSIVPTIDAWLSGRGIRRSAAHEQSRSVGLDYLRGLVVLFVLLAHTPTVAVYGNEWVVTIVHWLVKFAVEAFFVLSGWLIGDLIITDLHTWKEPRAFALFLHRRWARTLPIYWLVLALVVLAGWSGATIQSMQAYVVFVQNIWQIHPPDFLVAWSLCIEEWFYPIAALLLSIIALRQRPERALLLTLILLIGVHYYPVRQTIRGLFGVVGSSLVQDVIVTVLFYAGSFWLASRWHRELEQPMMRLRLAVETHKTRCREATGLIGADRWN